MTAINRAKRKFFLRPGYMVRHIGDVARLTIDQAGYGLAGAHADRLRRAGRRYGHARRGAPRRGRQRLNGQDACSLAAASSSAVTAR